MKELIQIGSRSVMSDTELKIEGYEILSRYMSLVEMERLISLVK